jgi:glycosyltransferase involved in cell wall biosynthesis
MIRALRAAGHEVLLEIVGALDVDEFSSLQKEVVAMGCDFRSLGFIANADLSRVVARWDVLFFPSRSEGCPRSILEATACGIPVVCVTGVIPDKLVDGQLVRAVDRAELPSAVIAVLSAGVGKWISAARPARRHEEGAADLDEIVEGLPAQPPKSRSAPVSTLRALASIASHSHPFRQHARETMHRTRRVMGRD